jgi:hypothetical protein
VKPTPLSALLADDLLLDRVGARLDTDDDLGSLLLAVAHQADTPIPRAAPTRRRRPHRGLTVLAALGVAVSGATVAAAVELAPVHPDQASGAPHLQGGLPRSLQALVLPFFAGTPFKTHLVSPFGNMPTGSLTTSLTAEGMLAADPSSVYPMGDPIVVGTSSPEDLQDPAREKTQGKGTPNDGTTLTDPSESGSDQGNQGDEGDQGDQGGEPGQPAQPGAQPKLAKTPAPPPATTIPAPTIPTPTITPIPTPVPSVPTNGQSTWHNGSGTGRGPGGWSSGSGTTKTDGTSTTAGTTSTGTTTGAASTGTTTGTTSGDTLADAAVRDDPASRIPPKGRNRFRIASLPPATGAAPTGTSTRTTSTSGTTGTTGTTTTTSTTPDSAATGSATP